MSLATEQTAPRYERVQAFFHRAFDRGARDAQIGLALPVWRWNPLVVETLRIWCTSGSCMVWWARTHLIFHLFFFLLAILHLISIRLSLGPRPCFCFALWLAWRGMAIEQVRRTGSINSMDTYTVQGARRSLLHGTQVQVLYILAYCAVASIIVTIQYSVFLPFSTSTWPSLR